MYHCQEGCSSCCGSTTTVMLTNMRVISRRQEPDICCCCIGGARIDRAMFLRDIQVVGEVKAKTNISCLSLFAAIIGCTWPSLLCCNSCCGDQAKTLEVKGGFGSELLIVKRSDIKGVANDISMLTLPFKERT